MRRAAEYRDGIRSIACSVKRAGSAIALDATRSHRSSRCEHASTVVRLRCVQHIALSVSCERGVSLCPHLIGAVAERLDVGYHGCAGGVGQLAVTPQVSVDELDGCSSRAGNVQLADAQVLRFNLVVV